MLGLSVLMSHIPLSCRGLPEQTTECWYRVLVLKVGGNQHLGVRTRQAVCLHVGLASKASISVIIPRMGVKLPVSHLSWVSLTLCRSTVTSLMDLLNAEGQGELLVF